MIKIKKLKLDVYASGIWVCSAGADLFRQPDPTQKNSDPQPCTFPSANCKESLVNSAISKAKIAGK